MADWRKAEDYDHTAKLSLRQWAWEFLRRSRAYRDLWQSYAGFWIAEKMRSGEVVYPTLLQERQLELGLDSLLPDPRLRADVILDVGWDLGVMHVNPFQPMEPTMPGDP